MARRTFVITFTLNFAWEMGQMSLYRGMKPLSPHSVMFCSLASVGNAGYTVFLLWIGRRILRNSRRALLLTAFRIVYIAGSGVITSVIVERVGLRAGGYGLTTARCQKVLGFVSASFRSCSLHFCHCSRSMSSGASPFCRVRRTVFRV